MQLNLKTDYSLRLLLFLALHPDELVTVAKVADAFDISAHHLSKVAQTLAAAGFIQLLRGRSGGIRLLAAPSEVNISRVIRTVEGSLFLVECFDSKKNTCVISPACGLKGILAEAQRAFFEVLERYTLADAVHNPKALRGLLSKYTEQQ